VDTVQAYALNSLITLGYRAMEELNSYVDDLSEDIVRHAIDNALDNGVRNWSYVRAILNQYVENGVKDVAGAKAVDESRKKGSAAKGAIAQADADEDHRPRAVVPERQDVDFIFDDNRVHLIKYRILRTGEEVPYSMIQAMCPGEIERFWDSKHVRWHN
jgi:DnaD/phage-associated family protein